MTKNLKKICWSVTLFLVLNPIISIVTLILYLVFSHSYTAGHIGWITFFGLIFAIATNLSITMGYHRLFSHKSYEAHPVLEAILLLIGAGAFQGSCLKWASDHRIHHRFEDTDKDPYSIKKGFFYAHMGWMMLHDSVSLPIQAPDLEKNKLVKIQHDYYMFWAIGVGYIMPLIVGAMLGNALLGLVIAGGIRIFLTQQSTFFINSLAHTLGDTPYSTGKSAKDSIIMAFLTHGEGYHNFHHKFQFDYRNGIRWYHWDPTKWSIQLASLVGLAKKLKTVQLADILRAKLEVESENFQNSQFFKEKLEPLSARIVEAQIKFDHVKAEYKISCQRNYDDKVAQLKFEMKLLRHEIHSMKKTWNILIKSGGMQLQPISFR